MPDNINERIARAIGIETDGESVAYVGHDGRLQPFRPDTDRAAAVFALEEYCSDHGLTAYSMFRQRMWTISLFPVDSSFRELVADAQAGNKRLEFLGVELHEVICEAILDAEGSRST